MVISRLWGFGFRNLGSFEFRPGGGVNILLGENGQGKTNLLEAVWLFCGAKSFRAARESEMVEFGGSGFEILLEFSGGGRENTAGIKFAFGAGKSATLGGVKLGSVRELSDTFRAVVFSPEHLGLVKGGPRERRQFLDVSLGQAYPKYAKVIEGYERILRHRSCLLADISRGRCSADMLDVWDEWLCGYGGYITWMRERYITKLAGYAAKAYGNLSGGSEQFCAVYLPGCGKLTGSGRSEITKQLSGAILESRKEDIRTGRTLIGPHRDDIEILLDLKAARSFGSQGQQRSCVLALKLGEYKILEESIGHPPIVLLDDVLSELDENRRQKLLSGMGDGQIIITSCEEITGTTNTFRVSRGIISA